MNKTNWPDWFDNFMKCVVASTGESKCYMDSCTLRIHKILDRLCLTCLMLKDQSVWGPVMLVIYPAGQKYWSTSSCLQDSST